MKRLVLYLLIFLHVFLNQQAYSNDGWFTTLNTSGGSLYSKIKHPDISLEQERIKFYKDGTCNVYFKFKNYANETIVLNAGFPVKNQIKLNYNKKENKLYIIEAYWDPLAKQLLDLLYNHNKKSIHFGEDTMYNYIGLSKEGPSALAFEGTIDYSQYLTQFGEHFINNFKVIQDNNEKKIHSVLLQFELKEAETIHQYADKNHIKYNFIAYFHFLHTLEFKPKCYSDLKIAYKVRTFSGSGRGFQSYSWNYILGTGATWKGSIKECVFVVPKLIIPKMPENFRIIRNDIGGNSIYRAFNYTPLNTDQIEIVYVDNYVENYIENFPYTKKNKKFYYKKNPK